MSDVTLLSAVFNAAVWLACGTAVGWSYARRDWQGLRQEGMLTRLRPWESRLLYERWLGVRRWKDRLPEAGTWFGGVSKRHLPSFLDGGRARFAAESLRAERVHFLLLAVIPLTMAWSRGWWVIINLVFGVAVNLPCIIVARYNRIRLTRMSRVDANS
ncbi:MAG: hypothetical protein RLZZ538_185 [Actinomycetota bacterium]|nr:hypothetical protein [Ilumatobacteraceae bacterium]